jgi:steroid delta-isomerase-like uncharacterized protein
MSHAHKEFARRWFEEVWNNRRREAIEEMFQPDCILHEGESASVGAKDFLPFWDRIQEAFSDLRVDCHECIAEGDYAFLRWSSHMRHTGEFDGWAPTGREVHITGMSLFRFKEDGRLAEAWQNWDMLGLLQQIEATTGSRKLYQAASH